MVGAQFWFILSEQLIGGNLMRKFQSLVLLFVILFVHSGCVHRQLSNNEAAMAYYYGIAVERDYHKAMKILHIDSESGSAISQKDLGIIYRDGVTGVIPVDYKKSLRFFRLSADQGYAPGQYGLGMMYYNGYGVKKNYKEASKWLRLAANQDDELAKELLKKIEEEVSS